MFTRDPSGAIPSRVQRPRYEATSPVATTWLVSVIERRAHGGLRLAAGWGFGRVRFSAPEAIDLLVSLAIAERIGSSVLLRQLPALERKIAASFRAAHQAQIRSLRRRILVGPPASAPVAASLKESSRRAHPALAEAFLEARRITIDHVDARGVRTSRQVEPHYPKPFLEEMEMGIGAL